MIITVRNRLLQSKAEGSTVIEYMVPTMMTIVITGMLAIVFAGWVSNCEKKETILSIAREYLLKMESTGYLTDQDCLMLQQELEEYDLHEVSLEGTTRTRAERGSEIYLCIEGNLELKADKMQDVFQWKTGEDRVVEERLVLCRKATALY